MKRKLLLGTVSVAAALTLIGCTSSGAPPFASSQDGTPDAQAGATPQRGGVFHTIGLRDLPHLHPWTNVRNNMGFLVKSIYETLVTYDYQPFQDYREHYRVVPSLAERWELRDNTVYTFNLRRNVRWHDGRSLTAHDVKFSFDYLADPANRLLGSNSFNTVASITAPDEFTLRIVTREPDVEFLEKLTESATAIMPKHAHERGDNFEKVVIGTGAFKVESNDRQRGAVYVPNRDYWKPGQPYVDKWRLLPATDDAGRIAAFIAGQNDVVKVANKVQAETVLAPARHAKYAPFLRDNTSDLFMKMDRPPFNDPRVRQALHLATDRQAMVDTLTMGDGLLNPPGINPIRKVWALPQSELATLPGWRSPKDQDIARAKQLLAEAGQSGVTFTIRVDRAHPDRPALSEMMSEQLRQMGVTAKLQPMESAAFQKAFVDGDYEAALYTGNAPDNWRHQIHSTAVLNKMPIRDAELDRLIDAQAREFDPAKRTQIIQELQRLLVRQTYVIPTITLVGYVMWQPYVYGWVDNQAANVSNLDWAQVWLDQTLVPKDR